MNSTRNLRVILLLREMIVDLPVKTPVAAAQPVILCDTREQARLIFNNLAS